MRERFDAIDLTGALEVIWGSCAPPTATSRSASRGCSPPASAAADQALLDTTLYTLADAVRSLGVLLHPFIPASAARMLEAVGDPGAVGVGAGRGRASAGGHRRQPAAAAVPAGVIDTHAHLELCDGPAEDLVTAAAAAGVGRILTVGRGQALELAERLPDGVGDRRHPPARGRRGRRRRRAAAAARATRGRSRWASAASTIYRDYAPRDDQARVFEAQIELANELGCRS